MTIRPKLQSLRLGLGYCRCLYSLYCREEEFSETEFPVSLILGNWASDKRGSRKLRGHKKSRVIAAQLTAISGYYYLRARVLAAS